MELLRLLIGSTGLPPESLEIELHRLIEARGWQPEQLTVDHLRELMTDYLQETLSEAKASLASENRN